MKPKITLVASVLAVASIWAYTIIHAQTKQNNPENKITVAKTTDNTEADGTLELSTSTNNLTLKMDQKVTNKNFKVIAPPITIKSEYNGIAFRYCDEETGAIDDGKQEIVMHVNLTFKNDKNWKEGDLVRVMSLNECDYETFTSLEEYFTLRINSFKNLAMTEEDLFYFNKTWNQNHDNKVNTYPYSTPKNSETNKLMTANNKTKAAARKTNQYEAAPKAAAEAAPKLTKKDIILAITVVP